MQDTFLLDTNICVHLLRGDGRLHEKMMEVQWVNCCISELTVAELYYGAECSDRVDEVTSVVSEFVASMRVIPFEVCIREYCRQKARLRRLGTLIEDIDLFIGSTAVAMGYVMVSENQKHLSRLEHIRLENWIVR